MHVRGKSQNYFKEGFIRLSILVLIEIADFGFSLSSRWLTLGNQLGPDQIYEEDLAMRVKAKYVLSNLIPPGKWLTFGFT